MKRKSGLNVRKCILIYFEWKSHRRRANSTNWTLWNAQKVWWIQHWIYALIESCSSLPTVFSVNGTEIILYFSFFLKEKMNWMVWDPNFFSALVKVVTDEHRKQANTNHKHIYKETDNNACWFYSCYYSMHWSCIFTGLSNRWLFPSINLYKIGCAYDLFQIFFSSDYFSIFLRFKWITKKWWEEEALNATILYYT